MTEIVPCLLRQGVNVKKYKILRLDKDQVTIGRSGDVTYAITSDMISRCHATIKHQGNKTWTITDNKSLNGTHVNGKHLEPFTPYILQEEDLVQFGVTNPSKASAASNTCAEFLFRFYPSLKIRIEKSRVKRQRVDSQMTDEKATLSVSESLEDGDDRKIKQRLEVNKNCSEYDDSQNKIGCDLTNTSQKELPTKEAEYLSRLAEMEKRLQEKEEYQKQVLNELEQERKEKENQAREMEELKMKEYAILMEMHEKQEQLEKEKEDLKKKMQSELEQHVKEKENALLMQLNSQRERLLKGKKEIESSLQKEMEKALEEKDKELEQELRNQKQKLEKVLEKKDMEQKMLESQLNETKKESATAKLEALKAREDILSNFVSLMEMELQCAICNELFIKATSLNCAHVFCKLCINQWMKVKKECPNCRTPITSQMQSLALDNYIDKMVEQLSDEMKDRRKDLVQQRKVEQDKIDKTLAGPSNAATATTAGAAAATTTAVRARRGRTRGGQAGRGRTRGGRGRRVTTRATATATANVIPEVIELSDDSLSSMSTDDSLDAYNDSQLSLTGDSDESMEGDRHAYYGGYGRCFSCGMRGHWANGCPN